MSSNRCGPNRRSALLVSLADAVVVVWDGRDANVKRVLALVERKGCRFKSPADRRG